MMAIKSAGAFLLTALLMLISPLWADTPPPALHGAYGIPVRIDKGPVRFPNFELNLNQRRELMRDDPMPPWIVWAYRAAARDGRYWSDFCFNSDPRINGHVFSVHGTIYFAEMHHSTGRGVQLLDDSHIVVWDAATAQRENPRLVSIFAQRQPPTSAWYRQRRKIDAENSRPGMNPAGPQAETLPAPNRLPDAFADGILVADVGAQDDSEQAFRASSSTGAIVRRLVLAKDPGSPVRDSRKAAYGVPIRPGGHWLDFGKWQLRLCEHSIEHDSLGDPAAEEYWFRAEPAGKQRADFVFTTATMANGRSILIAGHRYLIEMFHSSARTQPLRPGEIVVWDRATAKRSNPKCASVWTRPPDPRFANQKVETFADGIYLPIQAFTGTYLIGAVNWVEAEDLDVPVTPRNRVALVYPDKFRGTRLVANVHGYLVIGADGRVVEGMTTFGNCEDFQQPATTAVRQLQFLPPLSHGRPTQTLASFTWRISEPTPDTGNMVIY